MRTKLPLLVTAFALQFLLAAPSSVNAAPPTLDGRSYVGTVKDAGAEKGDPDTLIFEKGSFRSTACDQYGFTSAPYHSTRTGESFTFKAQTKNDSGNAIAWSGVVHGKEMKAHGTWSDSKGNTQEMDFAGAESAPEAAKK